MIKLAAFQANGAAYMKLRLPGNSDRIERRTSKRRILKLLRFTDFKTSEPQPATSPSVVQCRRLLRVLLNLFK